MHYRQLKIDRPMHIYDKVQCMHNFCLGYARADPCTGLKVTIGIVQIFKIYTGQLLIVAVGVEC